MKIRENVTLYCCDFCNKRLLRKHAMERHEKFCSSNPDNFRDCFNCKNLIEDTKEVDLGYCTKTVRCFSCKLLNIELYPPKSERLNHVKKYPHDYEGQHPMPTNCEHQESLLEFDADLDIFNPFE